MRPVGRASLAAAWLACCLLGASGVWAQRAPDLGYVYPAGGQRGTTLEVVVGGQYLEGAEHVYVSGEGVGAKVAKYDRPLTQREISQLRNKLEQARERLRKSGGGAGPRFRRGNYAQLMKHAGDLGVDPKDIRRLMDYRRRRSDPKRQPNPQLDETVTLEITIGADAAVGRRELRLQTATGLSNALVFHIGSLPEHCEEEPNSDGMATRVPAALPAVLNGQIMPGDVDRFRFTAQRGERLVAAVAARELIPYLADAVPGWFQATLTLYDAAGREVAFADDFRFHPDPVLYCEVPADGTYELQIADAIYRGREDFVYRITLGELPYVTSIYPLGGRENQRTTVELRGWNLPSDRFTIAPDGREPGIHSVVVHQDDAATRSVLFGVDTLTEVFEREPNDTAATAQALAPPLAVNGRIDEPGDWDVFRFEGRAGGQVTLEVLARRLNSPVDSLLKLTDADGKLLAANDDHEDKTAGLTTHHADALVRATLPADGAYFVHVGDTQHKGGVEYAYRLRLSRQRPDFALRVEPATINARTGQTVPVTVHAIRRDGFDGDVQLVLKNAPAGFRLSGARIPAGEDRVRLTLTVPPTPLARPARLELAGSATIGGRRVRRRAVPAENMTQAFIYQHLVPETEWLVSVTGPQRPGLAQRARNRRSAGRGRGRVAAGPAGLLAAINGRTLRLPAGGTAQLRLPVPAVRLRDQLQLELSDPPAGISIDEVVVAEGGVMIRFRADEDKIAPGQQGNLIVNAFLQRTFPAREGRKAVTRRIPLGTLPAIAYEIVDAG